MEFRLPENLQKQLIAYDPELKAAERLRKLQEQPSEKKKSRYTLGNVNDLIPFEIVPAEQQQEAVDLINAAPAPMRFHIFKKFVALGEEFKVVAILYYFEGMWVAAWLPEDTSSYFYGFTYAIKNTANVSKTATSIKITPTDPVFGWDYKKYGRTEFRIAGRHVTKELAINGYSTHLWNPRNAKEWRKRSDDIYKQCIKPFYSQLASTVPNWEDDHSMWSRINPKQTNYFRLMFEQYYTEWKEDLSIQTEEELYQWIPTVDSLISGYFTNRYRQSVEVLNTPFFRRWMQSKVEEIIEKFNDPQTKNKKDVRAPFMQLVDIARWIDGIRRVWPDTPVDYFQNNVDNLVQIDAVYLIRRICNTTVSTWLQKHMPVSTLFQLFNRHLTDRRIEWEKQTINRPDSFKRHYDYCSHKQIFSSGFSDLRDTLDMLEKVLNTNENLEPPKRWRISEFHDYVNAESWKLNNKNENLPQDLFPAPVKVARDSETWTFFQPYDVHQLGEWGQAVRNCVGNSSVYAEGVKKKKHFIVLSMVDGKPRFTIQLEVNGGLMSVKQIAGIHNKRLEPDEVSAYTEAFRSALEKREELSVT